MKTRILTIALAAASLTACALDPAEARRATAVAAGNNAVAPEQVKVSDIRNGSIADPAFRWHASAPNGEFECSAYEHDGVLTQTLCVKK
jgi:hypothetical protein